MSTTTNTSNQSHAIDPATTSNLPPKVQATLPESVEDALPNNIHDTGNPDKYSHDKGHSIVPERVAQSLQTKVEEVVPDAIHDTSGKKSGQAAREQAGRVGEDGRVHLGT
ncbi:hypothetical protein CLAFUW4_07813 [Fulvia fulva]|uniref:Uncharacterized protein n=1 Tax=Passalora fulva TaxID=5499 RepID=A0A9Q8P682_PASFU|nr:uncharacterized protein CLAFUR5_07937 [Fulvia fulva]KAK4629029.1 hypothetical protein CLAFUR4_07818 [Fulvia fulva]KAK4630373.1 hypothetical protein CLAFUR0_07815 [Fulvia fulva]UJO14714.1 hypothetical protein CLAFUR5_07937 [Fulvia fulva]WPV12177.1 hypothetical protein CLAFUW4_07813 [Fulvia fulva]WPV27534.1 hypothetical protein CLAFUW7_07814 [Fulvia fulva]